MLTRDYRETIQERIQIDAEFATGLLEDAITLLVNGEPNVARLLLRDLVKATIGFESLAALTNKPSKSLHRMLSAKGNPTMDNLAVIISALRETLKVEVITVSTLHQSSSIEPSECLQSA